MLVVLSVLTSLPESPAPVYFSEFSSAVDHRTTQVRTVWALLYMGYFSINTVNIFLFLMLFLIIFSFL